MSLFVPLCLILSRDSCFSILSLYVRKRESRNLIKFEMDGSKFLRRKNLLPSISNFIRCFIRHAHHAEIRGYFIRKQLAPEVCPFYDACHVENLAVGVGGGAFEPGLIEGEEADGVLLANGADGGGVKFGGGGVIAVGAVFVVGVAHVGAGYEGDAPV